MRHTSLLVVLLTAVGLGSFACGDGPSDTAAPDDGGGQGEAPDTFDTTVWELVAGTVDGEDLALVEGHPVTWSVTDGRVGGTAACNRYGASLGIDGSRLSVDELFWTEMACTGDGVMELESAYLGALPRVTTAERDADQLVLRGDEVELRFAARAEVAPSRLGGTTWQLDTLLDGDTASSVANAERATLVLDDGRLAGGTGCNRVTGPAEVVEDRLRAGPLASTRMFCEGVMQQEAHVLAVLEGGPTIAVEGDRLTLLLDDGRGLVYRAQPTP